MLVASFVLAASWSVALVSASCPTTTAVETLDVNQLGGKWYQLLTFGTFIIQGLGRCHETTITVNSDGSGFTMASDRINNLLNNQHIKNTWDVATVGDKPTGELTIKNPFPFFKSWVSLPLKVLGTDYKQFVVFYTCREFFYFFRYSAASVLTRKRHYEAKEYESIYASVDEILKKNGLSRSQFSQTDQSKCDDKSTSTPTNSGSATGTSETQSSQSSSPVEEKTPSETASDLEDLTQALAQQPSDESKAQSSSQSTPVEDTKPSESPSAPSDASTQQTQVDANKAQGSTVEENKPSASPSAPVVASDSSVQKPNEDAGKAQGIPVEEKKQSSSAPEVPADSSAQQKQADASNAQGISVSF